MAAQLLLINPRRRKRKHAKRAKSSRRRRHVVRAAAPRRRRRHRARAHNPIRRRSRRARAHNPIRRRRRHHNPFSSRGITSALVPAGIGALGAVGLDITFGYLGSYLPASLTSNPYIAAATKAAGAFGLGWLASKALGREKGKLVTAGALTVISYGLAKSLIAQAAPSLPGLSGMDGIGAYSPMGAYSPSLSGPGGFGAYNPAPYLAGTMDSGPGAMDGMFQ